MAKRALLVGVNEYEKSQIPDLSGCINDVLDTHFSLRSLFGFETKEIRVLTDSRATKDNIVYRLKWLVKNAKSGDYLFFLFSGHGSQIRDRDGEELEDNLDELICPHDMDWDGHKYITDDELNDLLKGVPEGALLEVMIDCCHSGTILREIGLEPPPELAPGNDIRYRFLPPPTDLLLRFSGKEDELDPRSFLGGFKNRKKKHHILWAACRADQVAAEVRKDERHHGAFTYYLNKHLRRDSQVSRDVLLERVRASLRHEGYMQVPQLELDATHKDRAVFSP
jgi:hypothetical protein